MWDDQRNAKSDYNSKNVKKCLSDKFIQNWNNNVMNSAKCLNYRIYKSNFCFEQYLSVLPSDLRMYLVTIYPLKLAGSLILIDLKDIVISVMLTNLVMSFITYSNVLFSTMLELNFYLEIYVITQMF